MAALGAGRGDEEKEACMVQVPHKVLALLQLWAALQRPLGCYKPMIEFCSSGKELTPNHSSQDWEQGKSLLPSLLDVVCVE